MLREVNILDMDQDGRFTCPKCGITIDPTVDDSEEYYIVDTHLRPSGSIEYLIIEHKCKERIKINLPPEEDIKNE